MSIARVDTLLLTASAMLAFGSAAVFGTLAWRAGAQGARTAPRQLSPEPYVATAPDVAPRRAEAWPEPQPQSRGRDWIYDTFTPPEIFYNARWKQFTVKPPSSLAEKAPQEEFGLELVAVEPEPFRLQLIGYVGGEGNWRGTFRNERSGEVFLGVAGQRVASLGLSIRQFVVEPQAIAVPESMSTHQRVATALVRDERSGRDITITHREFAFTGSAFAQVAETGKTSTREVRQGDTFTVGSAVYRVERVELVPPAIEVVKESPALPRPERRVLTPRQPDESPRTRRR